MFWRDVILACKIFYNSIWQTTERNIKEMPIWYNNRVCNYFNKKWFDNGIIFLNDLFNGENMVSLHYLRSIKGLKCNFLEYEIIRKKIADIVIAVNDYP